MHKVVSIQELNDRVSAYKRKDLKVGLVPTMGFLHSGHLSLIESCKKECDVCVVSVYVNPSQFNESLDFESYPKDLERDLKLLKSVNCDLVWVPEQVDVESIPLDLNYELSGADKGLEGEYREGHFKGVIEIVYRLFKAVLPHVAYFGEKDYQQFKVIETMAKNNDLAIKVLARPTVRENDGLAMSSRNVRLSTKDRKVAPVLHAVLTSLSSIENSDINDAKKLLVKKGFEVEYLTQYEFSEGGKRIFGAVKLGGVRLIDNVPLIKTVFQ
ncbi:MAG: pantoate--beta-alanine ligase [Saprospiraceae bacterium]|jgi:pantoate--beta-alanine ligase